MTKIKTLKGSPKIPTLPKNKVVTQDELAQINGFLNVIENIKGHIGALTLQQRKMATDHDNVVEQLSAYRADLEAKYGEGLFVNPQTGEITFPKKDK